MIPHGRKAIIHRFQETTNKMDTAEWRITNRPD